MAEDRFLVLPHPEVAGYYQARAADPDRWLGNMNHLQQKWEEERRMSDAPLRLPLRGQALARPAQRRPARPRQPRRDRAARLPRRRRPGPRDHPALAYFDGRLSYRETDALSDSVAGHLAARGLRRGDRVAIMLQNTPHFVLALLGAWKAGAIVVPLNPMYKSGEVGHVLKDAEVAALICADRAWDGVSAGDRRGRPGHGRPHRLRAGPPDPRRPPASSASSGSAAAGPDDRRRPAQPSPGAGPPRPRTAASSPPPTSR